MTDTAHSPSAPGLDPSALRHTGAARRVDKTLPRKLRLTDMKRELLKETRGKR